MLQSRVHPSSRASSFLHEDESFGKGVDIVIMTRGGGETCSSGYDSDRCSIGQEILTKLSMCLPASMKFAKFKHYERPIFEYPLSTPALLRNWRGYEWQPNSRGGSWRLCSSQFFPARTTRTREKKKKRRETLSISRNHRPDRYAFHKQRKK